MFCMRCGTETVDGARFCADCGAELQIEETAGSQPAAAPPAVAPPAAAVPPVVPSPSVSPDVPAAVAPVAVPASAAPPLPALKASPFARLAAQVVDGLITDMFIAPGAVLLAIELAARGAGNTSSDGMLYAGLALSAFGMIWALWYWLTKDGWRGGQGFGKRMFGLVTVREGTVTPAGKGASAMRQLVMVLISAVGLWIIEALMVLFRADGRRLGDLAAGTRVVRAADVPGSAQGAGKGFAAAMLTAALLVTGSASVWAAIALPEAVEMPTISPDAPVIQFDPTPNEDGSGGTSQLNEDLDDGTADRTREPVGFPTAEDAVRDAMIEDWVFDVFSDDGEIIEFIIGPPNSEYVDVLVIARQPDGSWLLEESYPFDMGDMDGGVLPEDEAAIVVSDFITAVQQDRPNDAQALTVSPFSEDPASASLSSGSLSGFEITQAIVLADGETVELYVTEFWAWDDELYVYTCVLTPTGYRISELRPQ